MATRVPLVIDLTDGRTKQKPSADTLDAGAAGTVSGYVEITQAAAPSTPAAGKGRHYIDSTVKQPTFKNEQGSEFFFRMRRVVAVADSSPVSTDPNAGDVFNMAACTGATTINAPATAFGAFYDGQTLEYRIKSAASQTLTWNSGAGGFRGSSDVALPSTTTGSSKYDRIAFEYHATDNKWDCVAVNKGF